MASAAFAASAEPPELERGVQSYEQGHPELALPLLAPLANDAAQPAAVRAHAALYQGLCQARMGDKSAAALAFGNALALDPSLAVPAGTPPDTVTLIDAVRAQARAQLAPRLEAAAQQVSAAANSLAGVAPAPPPTVAAAEPPPVEKKHKKKKAAAAAAPTADAPAAPQPQAVSTAPTAEEVKSGTLYGVDATVTGFFTGGRVSPSFGAAIMTGNEFFRIGGVISLLLGNDLGFGANLRFMGGTRPIPVGYAAGLDLGIIAIPSLTRVVLDVVGHVVTLTLRTGNLLFEFRLLDIGYFASVDNGSSFTLGGGIGMTGLP